MPTKQTSIRISTATRARVDDLRSIYGSIVEIVAVAVALLHRYHFSDRYQTPQEADTHAAQSAFLVALRKRLPGMTDAEIVAAALNVYEEHTRK